ncbi:MAG: hypothetical protein AMXMBFR44_3660 [Candidatus Campbellbacteria bacterium]
MEKRDIVFLEVKGDPELQSKKKQATKALRRFFPNCGPVYLYRTASGRVGIQAALLFAPGDQGRIKEAYRAVMIAIGENRGRRKGPDTVQVKLHLQRDIHSLIKEEARRRHTTMSQVVADAITRSR